MSLEAKLAYGAVQAVQELYDAAIAESDVQVQKTRPDFEGDLTVVVFPLLRYSKKNPEDTAKELGNWLVENIEEVSAYNAVKGFLNVSIAGDNWVDHLVAASKEERYGFAEPGSGRTIMVEYSSPNTNKPLHLGHIRNNLLGYSVSEILKANGHTVHKTQIINDRGIHICKSMLAWQKWGNGETPESSGIKGDHLVGKYYVMFGQKLKEQVGPIKETLEDIEAVEKETELMKEAQEMLRKWEAKDPEVYSLWETMNGWVYEGFDATYKQLGVDFGQLYYESKTWLFGKEQVLKGLEEGVFYKKDDGSVWVDLEDDGLDQKVLLRSDGTAVYMTQDIGTAIQRYIDHSDLTQLIYTVGNEQDYHFKVLFLILGKLGYEWAKNCYHLSYGMVELPEGKMKTREGTVVDADDLMDEMIATAGDVSKELGKIQGLDIGQQQELFHTIGLGALKYFMLKVDPKKRMVFQPEESIDFNGNTGPFIQYTYARIQSILRKAADKGVNYESDSYTDELLPEEQSIIQKIYDFPAAVSQAGEEYSPAIIANYTYDLVKAYNHFYQTVPVLKEEDKEKLKLRLLLSFTTARVIKRGMGLLGINVPERM